MDEEFFISGGISGAITDPRSEDADKHAEMYYKEIRTFSTDISRISQNTGFTYDQVLMIKNYLFMFYHDINGRLKQFDACFEIAESWRRLAFDKEHIQPHDLTLLSHELLEMDYMNRGRSQAEAHKKASEVYNYAEQSEAYYKSLKEKKGQQATPVAREYISGGLSLGYNTH